MTLDEMRDNLQRQPSNTYDDRVWAVMIALVDEVRRLQGRVDELSFSDEVRRLRDQLCQFSRGGEL